MSHKIQKKFLNFEIKDVNDDERSFTAVASDERRDRDGDVMVAEKWKLKNYKKNPVVLWSHNWSQPPIAKAADVRIEDNKLVFKPIFAKKEVSPFADEIFQLFKGGFLNTFSVGFLPYKFEDLTNEDKKGTADNERGRRIHAELLEISAVPVPSNPGALAQRGMSEIYQKCLNMTVDECAEMESDLLPHHHNDGAINLNLLKGSMALVLGARGGIKCENEDERKAFYNHLAKHYRIEGITPPEFMERSQDELKTIFEDVWHDELLDVKTIADNSEEKSGRVLSAKNRNIIKNAITALNELLEATEEDKPDPKEEDGKDLSTEIKELSELVEETKKVMNL